MELICGTIYSGVLDGFALAAKWAGIECKWQVEIKARAHAYLNNNYPNTKKFFNDEEVGKHNLEWVNIILSGDPCQPSSNAGLRLGQADPRFRWPQNFRIVRELHPDWFINENVTGTISNLALDQKIIDLESEGYTCQAFNFPAVSVGAHHERQRIFIVANSYGERWKRSLCSNNEIQLKPERPPIELDSRGNVFLQFEKRMGEPALFPVSDGLSDQIFRLNGTGDAVVPQIPFILLTYIKQIDELFRKQHLPGSW